MLNQAMLIGRLGADPEVRYLPDGSPVANFRMATDQTFTNSKGERIQRTEWHRIVTFGKLAEIAGDYLKKGRLVMVQGRIQTRSWEDKEKVTRYTTEIVGASLRMLDPKPAQEAPPAASESDNADPLDEVPF